MSNTVYYTPFLKLKQNEIMALKELDENSISQIIPFFDFPKGNDKTQKQFESFADTRAQQIVRHLGTEFKFYLDTFDAKEFNNGTSNSYEFLLEKFSKSFVIPVTGLSRSSEHRLSINNATLRGLIRSNTLGFRIVYEDIISFAAVREEIGDALSGIIDKFQGIDLIIDLRVCTSLPDFATAAGYITNFISEFSKAFRTEKVIITGSSISAIVSDFCATNSNTSLERKEIQIFSSVKAIYSETPPLSFGDYTVVSPNFVEVDLAPKMMRTVMTSKLIYSYEQSHYVWRGKSMKQEGEKQYNEHIRALIKKPFCRRKDFSWADGQFFSKQNDDSGFTASTMIKHTVNAHIEYMVKSYKF